MAVRRSLTVAAALCYLFGFSAPSQAECDQFCQNTQNANQVYQQQQQAQSRQQQQNYNYQNGTSQYTGPSGSYNSSTGATVGYKWSTH